MATQAQAQPQASGQPSPAQLNMAARQLILRGGVVGGVYQPPAIDMLQPLNPVLPSGTTVGSVLTFQVRNVGLLKRFYLRFKATVTAGASTTQTLTPLGLMNFLSNITLWDLGNQTRINTYGAHLHIVSSAKRRRVFGAAYTSDTPNGFGNINNRIMYAPATIAATDSSEIDVVYEIPLVKNDVDLRGAIWSDVTNAVMQIQVTLNPNMFVASTADPTFAVYQSGGSDLATLSGISVQLFQNYLDRLPSVNNAPILPLQDIGTAYVLNQSASGLPIANQDNTAAFTNSRIYESVAFVYDNNGTLNVNGDDINYIAVQSANFTNTTYVDGKMIGLMQRNTFMDDPPAGTYYLDFRHRPIDTTQYGNTVLTINPSNVGGAGALISYFWEGFAIIGLVNQGGAILSGGR
jgi:hypothetical protein